MIVGSVYLNEDRSQGILPYCYEDLAKSFICSIARGVEAYYVFVPRWLNRSQLIPDRPPNVHLLSLDELFEGISSQRIDIWHDLGYGTLRTMEQLRALCGQQFYITGDFRMEKFTDYADSGRPDWAEYDGIIYPTEHARNVHRLHSQSVSLEKPSAIIPPSINFDCADMLEKQDARSLLGLPHDEVLFFSISDFSPRFGTDFLPIITSFELTASKHANCRLIISGRDQYGFASLLRNNLLQRKISNRITILPNPDWHALVSLFAATDVFLSLPDAASKDSPFTLLYAMGNKLAPIVARWPLIEPLVEHRWNGLILPLYSNVETFTYLEGFLRRESNELGSMIISQASAFDVKLLAAYMNMLVEDVNLREFLGHNAFARARALRQCDEVAASYIKFWATLKGTRISKCTSDCAGNVAYFRIKGRFLDSIYHLDDEKIVRLTELGNAILEGKPFHFYPETTGLLFMPVVVQVLDFFKQPAKLRGALDVLVNNQDPLSRQSLRSGILYHILFCLKRGFLNWDSVT